MDSKFIFKPIFSSFLFLMIAVTLGLIMRSAFVFDLPESFDYRNIQHAHSHIALLGWLFALYSIVAIYLFQVPWQKFKTLFWLLQFTVLGMLITFPIYGYDVLSVVFTSAQMLLSYLFVYKFFKEVDKTKVSPLAWLFMKTSLVFLVVSTIGPWALGPIVAMGLKGKAIYYAAIQLYLHFQFNGWFFFAMLAIAFEIFHRSGITLDVKTGRIFYKLLTISTILTYALAISWSTPYFGIFLINSLGVLLQIIALYYIIVLLKPHINTIKRTFNSYVFWTFSIAFIAFTLKMLIQFAVVFPFIAEVSYTIRNFVIGFIHLLMLGCFSLFGFGLVAYIRGIKLSNIGTWLFIIGIILTEILLFVQGLMFWVELGFLPYYYHLMLFGSAIMWLGVLATTINYYKKRK